MKNYILFILLSLFSFGAFSNCELNYLDFCSSGGDKFPNMCPKKLDNSLKSKCIVNTTQLKDILEKCEQDKISLCGDLDDFNEIFVCLSFPGHWQNMDQKCLSSLTQGLN